MSGRPLRSPAPPGGRPGSVSVLVEGAELRVDPERPLVVGRADAHGVLGLDANDMGISALACSIEAAWGVWWVINQSTKRPLLLEHPAGPAHVRLTPGHRHAITTEQLTVLVPGAIYTHVLEVGFPGVRARAVHQRGPTQHWHDYLVCPPAV